MTRKRLLHLVSGGRTDYRIHVSPKAEPAEIFAAEELQRYLQQITGVRVPISESARGGKVIRVGATGGTGVVSPSAGEDGFVIRTRGDSLVLTGATPRATLFAVYAFLEDLLGCAWLSPGEEYVPATDRVSVPPLNRLEVPDFAERMLVQFPIPTPMSPLQTDWMAKRRLNESLLATNNDMTAWTGGFIPRRILPELQRRGLRTCMPGHAFLAWLPPARYAARHPEYYALVGGKREPHASLCISNPDVAREVAVNIGAFADEYPQVDRIALWHNDGAAWCECDACRAWQDNSESCTSYLNTAFLGRKVNRPTRVKSRTAAEMRFVNRVAEILARTHPRLTLDTLAYGSNCAPSGRVVPRENVSVGFALFDRLLSPELARQPLFGGHKGLIPTAQYVTGWRAQSERFYLYEYYGFFHDFAALWDVMREDFQSCRRRGIRGISSEIGTDNDLHMYFFARLAWNSRTPVDAILRTWCRAAYGPAAATIEEFWQTLRRAGLPWTYGTLSDRLAGLPVEKWDAARRRAAKWSRAEKRCMALLDSANELLRRAPLVPDGPAAQALPRALDRVRQLQCRWAEPVVPWC